MAIIPYDRVTNLQNDQALHPSDPYPAPKLDQEYNAIKITTDDIIQHLDLIQNDDGTLKDFPASAVEFEVTPGGGIQSTNVQDALEELDAEKAPVVHTHTASQITDFGEATDDRVSSLLQAGAGISLVYADNGASPGSITITSLGSGPGGGTGDVIGPASAVNGNLAVFDGASGKLIKDGGPVPTGSGAGVTDGDKGDIQVTNTGATWDINPNKVGNVELAQMIPFTLKANATGSLANAADIAGFSGFTAKGAPAAGDLVLIGDSAAGGVFKTATLSSLPTPTLADNAVTNLKLADMPALTLKGNFTGAGTDPADIANLSLLASKTPAGTDFLLLSDMSAGGAFKKTLISSMPGATSIGEAPTTPPGSVYSRRGSDASWVLAGGIADGTYGDIQVGSSGTTFTVIADAISFAKMQNIPTDTLIGRDTASDGDPESIALGASLSMNGAQMLQRAALTGDVTAPINDNALTIAANAVTNAKAAQMAAFTIKSNATGALANGADIANFAGFTAKGTPVAADTILIGDSAASGVFKSATLSSLINTAPAADSITNAMLADAPGFTLKGNNTSGALNPLDLTSWAGFTAKGTLVAADTILVGDSAAGGVFKSAAISALPAVAPTDGSITNAKLAQVTAPVFKGRNTAGLGAVEDMTPAQATSMLNQFTAGAPGLKGLVPPATAGTDDGKFLRADGSWQAASGGSGLDLTADNTWTGIQGYAETAMAPTSPIVWNVDTHPVCTITLNGGVSAMDPPINVVAGRVYTIRFVAAASSLSWSTTFDFAGGTVPVLTSSGIDRFTFIGRPLGILEEIGRSQNIGSP